MTDGWTTTKIPDDIYNELKRLIKEKQVRGYKSVTKFVTDAVIEKIDKESGKGAILGEEFKKFKNEIRNKIERLDDRIINLESEPKDIKIFDALVNDSQKEKITELIQQGKFSSLEEFIEDAIHMSLTFHLTMKKKDEVEAKSKDEIMKKEIQP